MKKVFTRIILLVFVCLLVMISCCMGTDALDDKYTIKELGLSIKIPKDYAVVTRELERDDDVFTELKLDYDETMTAFSAADIYLQAVSDDEILKITLTETSDDNSKAINNYSELSESQRKQVLDTFMNSGNYTSGVEIKHNGSIYFDFALTQQSQKTEIFCYQCHTVVNGMNINLTLHKNTEDFTADEIKVITDMANTISFDKIELNDGPSFEWWRFLIWIAILVVIALLAKYLYSWYNSYKGSQLRNRHERKPLGDDFDDEDVILGETPKYKQESGNLHTLLSELGIDNGDEELSFDELLGYDTTDYKERANTQFESFDIKVKSKNKSRGVAYFEDSGKGINQQRKYSKDSNRDFFDDYFSDSDMNVFGNERGKDVSTNKARIGNKSLKNFYKNLSSMIFSNDKKR